MTLLINQKCNMNDLTFVEWLKEQKHRDDPVGDLANDVPDSVETLTDLRNSMYKFGASIHAWDAYDEAWGEYKKFLKSEEI